MHLHSPTQFDSTNSKYEIISNIINVDLPEQLKNLSDNAENLERVAQYCEDIYVNSKDLDKRPLFNETKGFTNQALASISYQIFLIANSYLKLFETQLLALNDASNELSSISQEVNIHKEKVARREIGFITTNKIFVPGMKIKRSEMEEKAVKYIRKPIDYSSLDDIGHGVKTFNGDSIVRQNSYTTSSVYNEPINQSVNYDDFPTPPLTLKSSVIASLNSSNGRDTIRSTTSGSSYYNRPSVAVILPPSVPSEYLSRQELGIYLSKKELNQSGCSDYLSNSLINQCTLDFRRSSQTSAGLTTGNSNNNNNQSQKFNNNSNSISNQCISSEYSSSYLL